MTAPAARREDDTLHLSGDWTSRGLASGTPDIGPAARVDLSGITALDTFGAVALLPAFPDLASLGNASGGEAGHARLLRAVAERGQEPDPEPARQGFHPLSSIGRTVVEAGADLADLLYVLGRVIVTTGEIAVLRGRFRPAAFVNQFHTVIIKAIPIVALITFVVGIILTQQSIVQLRNFGATIFVVDLAGILMLREAGILLAAIMVAGRSGSAIAAEIGAMRMREEVDALEVMGLDTYRSVVMPRFVALVLGMPALGLIGAISGILGAALVARVGGGISIETFMSRLATVVDMHTITVGMVKAPVMAAVIGIIAVSEGMRVSGSTDSLGRHTTASVVKAIFAVIVIDGLFAVFFAAIGF